MADGGGGSGSGHLTSPGGGSENVRLEGAERLSDWSPRPAWSPGPDPGSYVSLQGRCAHGAGRGHKRAIRAKWGN